MAEELLLREQNAMKKEIVNLLSFIPQILRDQIDESDDIDVRMVNRVTGDDRFVSILYLFCAASFVLSLFSLL